MLIGVDTSRNPIIVQQSQIQISKCICTNFKIYLHKLRNIFVQIENILVSNCKICLSVDSEVLTPCATIFVQQSQIQISSLQIRTRDQESLAAEVEGTFLLFKVITNLVTQLV